MQEIDQGISFCGGCGKEVGGAVKICSACGTKTRQSIPEDTVVSSEGGFFPKTRAALKETRLGQGIERARKTLADYLEKRAKSRTPDNPLAEHEIASRKRGTPAHHDRVNADRQAERERRRRYGQ